MDGINIVDEITTLLSTINQRHTAYPQNDPAPILDQLNSWLDAQSHNTDIQHGCVCLFLNGKSASGAQLLSDIQSNTSPLNTLCESFTFDFRVYDMEQDGDIKAQDNARALSYGMMAVDEAMDCLIIASDVTQPYDLNQGGSIINFLEHSNAQNAAILGAMIAAKQADIPVIADGEASKSCRDFLLQIAPNLNGHILLADSDIDIMEQTSQSGLSALYLGIMLKAACLTRSQSTQMQTEQ